MRHRSVVVRLTLLLASAALVYVAWQAAVALARLEDVERERDTWQRPDDVIGALAVDAGSVVVDLGSGSGYFALRLASAVGPTGRVIAVDVQRQPLAFLWIRKTLRRNGWIEVVLGEQADPGLKIQNVDAVLIVNTYHELVAPAATLAALHGIMKPGARLVVTDRRPRGGPGATPQAERARHMLSPGVAEAEIEAAGFDPTHRDDAFIDRAGDEPWWLMIFTRR